MNEIESTHTQMIARMSPYEYMRYRDFKKLYEDETVPVEKIAHIFKISHTTVTVYAKKYNLKLRSRGRKSKLLDKFYKK